MSAFAECDLIQNLKPEFGDLQCWPTIECPFVVVSEDTKQKIRSTLAAIMPAQPDMGPQRDILGRVEENLCRSSTCILKTLRQGSTARHTHGSGSSDMDVLLFTNVQTVLEFSEKQEASSIFCLVRGVVQELCSDAVIEVKKRAVGVTLAVRGEKVSFDFVPCVAGRFIAENIAVVQLGLEAEEISHDIGIYVLVRSEARNHLILSSPFHAEELVKILESKYWLHTRDLIRLAKNVNVAHGKPLASFHVECLVLHFIVQKFGWICSEKLDLADAFVQFLWFMSNKNWQRPLYPPGLKQKLWLPSPPPWWPTSTTYSVQPVNMYDEVRKKRIEQFAKIVQEQVEKAVTDSGKLASLW